jgi:hypothetical protein
MRTRICIAAVLAVLLALPISIGLAAQANDYPVGRAYLTSGSTGVGTALITRQLTTNQTHVALHVKNLTPATKVTWTIESGSFCGTPSTATLLSQRTSISVTSVGVALSSVYMPGTLSVTSGTSMMTFHVYDASTNAELGCGQIYGQPSLGSEHWW